MTRPRGVNGHRGVLGRETNRRRCWYTVLNLFLFCFLGSPLLYLVLAMILFVDIYGAFAYATVCWAPLSACTMCGAFESTADVERMLCRMLMYACYAVHHAVMPNARRTQAENVAARKKRHD